MKKKAISIAALALSGILLTTALPTAQFSTSAAIVAPKAENDPLNPLTPEEIDKARGIIVKSGHYKTSMVFNEITLREPDKQAVWKWVLESSAYKAKTKLKREANFVISDQRDVYEGVIDLDKGTLTSWKKNTSGGYSYLGSSDEASKALSENKVWVAALKKRGITDMSKVIAFGLSLGYYGPNDADPSRRLVKYTAYYNTGDGNFFTHPIENLVATLDIDKNEVVKIEEGDVVPIPMNDHGFVKDDKTSAREKAKPILIMQPKGVNYQITGQQISWQGWKFHVRLDPRVGPIVSAAAFNDNGKDRKVMYQGNLGGMTVPYGDPSMNWYWKTYMDAGEYGVGKNGRPLLVGSDVPNNASLIDATLNDDNGKPYTSPSVIGVFERYADADWTHKEGAVTDARPRLELVVRFVATVGNYDYIFDYVFQQNGNIKINVGASGVAAIKGVTTKTVFSTDKAYIDEKNKDLAHGTLIEDNAVAVYHQHIYNFRLDMDVDGQKNTVLELDPYAAPLKDNPVMKSSMMLKQKTYYKEQDAIQKFDPDKIVLVTSPTTKNEHGYLTGYQVIANAGGTHPFAQDALFADDDWLMKRAGYLKNHIWVTPYSVNEQYPDGKYINQNPKDTGLASWAKQNRNIYQTDNVVWITTGTTHIPRAEEFPMMSTEWASTMLKPFNFLDRTPTLDLPKTMMEE